MNQPHPFPGFSHAIVRWGVLAALVGVIFFAVPLMAKVYELRVLNNLLLYMLLGAGLTIVVGYAGLLDLGFVAFYAIGAYSYAILASAQFDFHLPFLLVLAIGTILAAFTGLLLGYPVMRLRGDYLAIVTLGFGEIIRIIINNWNGLTNGPKGIARIDRPDLLGWQITTPRDLYLFLLVVVILVYTLVFRLERSLLGKAWRAMREDQVALRASGVDTTRLKLLAFALSASIGGAAGVFFAASQRFVSPESFVLHESILIVVIVVIGGVANLIGTVIGAFVVVIVPELLRGYQDYRMLLFGLLLVLGIILRPEGLVPQRYGIGWILKKTGWR
ncbi:branched-chain amino acid ABC transporter permease [Mesorhizobium sp. Root102]|uniref:branched-chain amino acid ABC transporter permease n=1 Tax=Mesorhizobium sp. Root102 TaxID=1736422 RepID=UPI000A4FD0A1|nr:branched-chain amino acid ABC transporter permease [Mesorhizobium sp. Root102]